MNLNNNSMAHKKNNLTDLVGSYQGFKPYRKRQLAYMRPFIEGEKLPDIVSISSVDLANGSPKTGDMIALNPVNEDDMWLVAKEFFEDNYVEADLGDEPQENLNFGQALEALKKGERVTRKGWNGKDMFLFLLPAGDIPKKAIHDPKLKEVIDEHVEGDTFPALPSIRMWTTNSEGRRAVLTGWLASQTDMLEEDWMILD